jgi:hypothetical protein
MIQNSISEPIIDPVIESVVFSECPRSACSARGPLFQIYLPILQIFMSNSRGSEAIRRHGRLHDFDFIVLIRLIGMALNRLVFAIYVMSCCFRFCTCAEIERTLWQ